MKDNFHIVIPARLNSTRLPGKMLLDINGKPLLQHVYERALASKVGEVIVATDSVEIADVATDFGARVCLTAAEHSSGTERIGEVVEKLEFADDDFVINVQGDEPFLPPTNITALQKLLLNNPTAFIATLCHQLEDDSDINNSNKVKVVMDKNGKALYFSRHAIPYVRDKAVPHYGHIGIYGYSVKAVKEFVKLTPSPLEQAESLEQLRALWHGKTIVVAEIRAAISLGVDTKDDLEKARQVASGF